MEANSRYLQLFDSSSDPFFLVTGQGRIIDSNQAAVECYGYSMEELLEMKICDLSLPSLRDPSASPVKNLPENGMRYQWTHLTKDGKELPVEIHAIPMVVEGKELILSTVRHINETIRVDDLYFEDAGLTKQAEQKLLESEKKYRVLFENSINEVVITEIIVDENGYPVDFVFLEVNNAFEERTGFKTSDVIGKRVTEVYPGIEKKENTFLDLHREVALTGLPASAEIYSEDLNEYFFVNAYKLEGDIVVGVSQITTERKIAEQKLRESEKKLAEAQHIAHVGSWDYDILGGSLYWSDETYRIFGYRPQEFECIYDTFLNIVHPDDRDFVTDSVNKAWYEDKLYSIDHRIVLPDGSERIVHEQAEVMFNEQGHPTRMVGTVQDITERKQAENSLRIQEMNYRKLFENNMSGVIITEMVMDETGYPTDFIFREVNDAFETHSGLKAENVLDKRVTEVLPGIENNENTALVLHRDVVLSGIPSSSETYSEYLKRHFSINAYPIKENTVVGVFQNISERKKAEMEIKKLNAELEQRVAERTSDLEKANKELEAFTYSVSHDLRTPLRAIDGFSRILTEDYEDVFDDEAMRLFGIIRSNTKKMDQLITDLLSLSRIARNEMNLDDIDMTAMVKSIFVDMVVHKDEKNFVFTVPDMPHACADSTLIGQLWTNLLSNAMKYSMKNDEIKIEVGSYTEDGMNVYYVKDNGVGFDQKYNEKLFGIFQRLHSETEFSGTGVGLAIVQRIVSRHEGKVWAEGKPNEGATFYFSLPYREDEHISRNE